MESSIFDGRNGDENNTSTPTNANAVTNAATDATTGAVVRRSSIRPTLLESAAIEGKGLHCISTTQRFSSSALCGVTAGSLGPLAGVGAGRTLSVLAQRLIG